MTDNGGPVLSQWSFDPQDDFRQGKTNIAVSIKASIDTFQTIVFNLRSMINDLLYNNSDGYVSVLATAALGVSSEHLQAAAALRSRATNL